MIERAEVLVLTHPLSRTRLFSTGSNVTRDSIVVRLEDGDGHVGWGETYLVPGAVEASRTMTEALRGRDPDDALAELVARPDSHRWALGAVTMALDDLRGRSRGVPVSSLYGARLRDRVRPYASSRGYVEGRSPLEAWSEEAAITAADGFHAMKLRIGRYDLDDEIAAIEQVAGAHPAMTWMADGNGAYSLDESRRLGAVLDALGFRWLEEPLPTDDYAAYAPLAGELSDPAGRRRDPRVGRGGRPVPRGRVVRPHPTGRLDLRRDRRRPRDRPRRCRRRPVHGPARVQRRDRDGRHAPDPGGPGGGCRTHRRGPSRCSNSTSARTRSGPTC